MAIRKDGVNQNLDERNKELSAADYDRVNSEENADTREVSGETEEDLDDEELEDDELTEEDFDVDEEDEEDDVE